MIGVVESQKKKNEVGEDYAHYTTTTTSSILSKSDKSWRKEEKRKGADNNDLPHWGQQ